MDLETRLDRHTGGLMALETAFSLLVVHLEQNGRLDRPALISDLERLAGQPNKDADVLISELRLIRTLRML